MPDTIRPPLVLLVEDERSIQDLLEKILRLHGFDVVTAATADEAFDALRACRVDAAIVDLRLPQGSGREVLVSIPQPAPVIIFSAVPDESSRLELVRPRTRLVAKPSSLVLLAETLKAMLAEPADS